MVRLEDEVDINSSAELKQALLEGIASGKELHLDLQAGPNLDITSIQLLWAAKQEAEARGIHFAVDGNVPESVTATLIDAGFKPFLASLEAYPVIEEKAHD